MGLCTHDNAAALLNGLAKTIKSKNDLLQKSREENSLHENINSVVEKYQKTNVFVELINKSFSDLQNDFQTGKLNRARYSDYLKKYKHFFDDKDLIKADLPKELNASDILLEIEKYAF